MQGRTARVAAPIANEDDAPPASRRGWSLPLAAVAPFGIAGVILSVPVALAVKTTLAMLYGDEEAK